MVSYEWRSTVWRLCWSLSIFDKLVAHWNKLVLSALYFINVYLWLLIALKQVTTLIVQDMSCLQHDTRDICRWVGCSQSYVLFITFWLYMSHSCLHNSSLLVPIVATQPWHVARPVAYAWATRLLRGCSTSMGPLFVSSATGLEKKNAVIAVMVQLLRLVGCRTTVSVPCVFATIRRLCHLWSRMRLRTYRPLMTSSRTQSLSQLAHLWGGDGGSSCLPLTGSSKPNWTTMAITQAIGIGSLLRSFELFLCIL